MHDGLLFHLMGSVEGRRHDMTPYRHYTTEGMLEAGLMVEAMQLCLFSDKAYLACPWLQMASRSGPGVELDEEQELYTWTWRPCE